MEGVGERERETTCSVDSIILPRATSAAGESRQVSGDFDPNQSGTRDSQNVTTGRDPGDHLMQPLYFLMRKFSCEKIH